MTYYVQCSVSGAIILKIAYGYTIEPNDPDPLVDIANETLDIFSKAFVPGKWLVDVLPFRMCSHLAGQY